MTPAHRLHTEDPPPLLGLAGGEGLPEAEASMVRLGLGPRLGRVSLIVREHLDTGGHRMRARLALAAAEALGVPRAEAVPWAAACELLHNATLLHDDIQDGDRTRRGAPTAWVRHGIPQAINAGDLLLVLPARAIEELSVTTDIKWRLVQAVVRAAESASHGQSADMDLPQATALGWTDWRAAAEGKTGALLALPVHGAALLAGLGEDTAARLAAPFGALGVVYQMLDDLADLDAGADLAAGRVSAVVAAHAGLYPFEGPGILELLRGPVRTEAVVVPLLARLRSGGAVEWVQREAQRTALAALADPTLRAVPPLRAVAEDLLARVRRNA